MMIRPVFTPPPRIDATNGAEFIETVGEHVAGYGGMLIDCSEVEWIAISMMHALETASVDAQITLVNPNPSVHLMAATFAREIQCRYERVSASERTVPGRLMSVHA